MTTTYEGMDDEEELQTVPIAINTNNVNVLSDSDSGSSKDDIENNDDNIFDGDIDNQVNATPQTTINVKVVQAMKKL